MAALLFDTVTIIGVGLLGGSYGLALKERGLARRIIGVPRRAETIPQAVELGAIDEGTLDPLTAVSGADLVLLVTPVLKIREILKTVAPALPEDCIVSDAGSSKGAITDVAESLALRRFVGGHPMAGSEKKGVEHARADLFVGATYFLTPTSDTDESALAALDNLARSLGAAPVVLAPETHDRIVAVTSHLPHLLAASLVRLMLAEDQREPLTRKGMATGLRDFTRIAAGDAEVWGEIFLSNRKELLEALRKLGDICAEARMMLENEDDLDLAEWLAEARNFREEVYGAADGASDRAASRPPTSEARSQAAKNRP